MDGDVFPNTIDYWGRRAWCSTATCRSAGRRQDDNSHFAVAIERPATTSTREPALIEARGPYVNNDESCRTLRCSTDMAPTGARAGRRHPAQGGLRAQPRWQQLDRRQRDGWASTSHVFNVLEKDAIRLQVVYGEGIASYMNDGAWTCAARDLRRGRRTHRPLGRSVRSQASRVLRPLLEREVVELDRLQLHGSGQHQLPGPDSFQKIDYARATCCITRENLMLAAS